MYESSNGGHKIGKVTLFTEGGHADKADVKWTAECGPMARVSGRWKGAGSHVYHCDQNASRQNGILNLQADHLKQTNIGGYTMAHEWGHFFYGLLDEYKQEGASCDYANNPGNPCEGDTGVTPSVMNDGDNAAKPKEQGGGYQWLNFSSAKSQNSKNAHYRVFGKSAWETLVTEVTQSKINTRIRITNKNNVR